jgi:hypothetical protein
MIPRPDPVPGADGSHHEPVRQDPAREPGPDESGSFVRPFYLTGGRTYPLRDGLRLHTIVTAPPSALHAPLRFEQRRIVELCQQPLSVAEIASGLGVPVGVGRVLIADLVAGGYVTCHNHDEDSLSVDLIERIAQRVRAL